MDSELAKMESDSCYSEGCGQLAKARTDIMYFSLPRAQARIRTSKALAHQQSPKHAGGRFDYLVEREVGDSRPLSGCALSAHDGIRCLLATCSFSGNTTLWSFSPQLPVDVAARCHYMSRLGTLRVPGAASIRATDIAFCPTIESTKRTLVTCYGDGVARLWSVHAAENETEDRPFSGRLERTLVHGGAAGLAIARAAFHPSSKYLATAGFDKTWRLWDVESGMELLEQDGHSRSVYGIAFQCDGSLIASCGLDALARIWDLRTGRCICSLEGHVKAIYGVDFSPNGYHLATGSDDHTCKIWDLRQRRLLSTIPAHCASLSRVKYEPQQGHLLVTASYDHTTKIWSSTDFQLCKVLLGHEGHVTGLDMNKGAEYIMTASHDRSFTVWSHHRK